jgi:hypothetical protein
MKVCLLQFNCCTEGMEDTQEYDQWTTVAITESEQFLDNNWEGIVGGAIVKYGPPRYLRYFEHEINSLIPNDWNDDGYTVITDPLLNTFEEPDKFKPGGPV